MCRGENPLSYILHKIRRWRPHGADVENEPDDDDDDVVVRLIERLIDESGADPNIQNNTGHTALMLAVLRAPGLCLFFFLPPVQFHEFVPE